MASALGSHFLFWDTPSVFCRILEFITLKSKKRVDITLLLAIIKKSEVPIFTGYVPF